MGNPPWLDNAEKYKGFHEVGENRGIEHFIELAHTGDLGDPWCAIFVNACLEEAGYQGTRSAAARSFEHDSKFMRLQQPVVGCIVTRWRGSEASGLGHVYFFLGKDGSTYRAIAGNEDDAVREYQEDPSKVTGFWWPKAANGLLLGADAPPVSSVLFQVTGKVSTFGGPDDTGVKWNEGLALFSSEAQMRSYGLGDYLIPPYQTSKGPAGVARRLNAQEKYYLACRWDYNETPLELLRTTGAVVKNPRTGVSIVARPVDWGPNIHTGRAADLSPRAAHDLGLQTDDVCTVTISGAVKPLPPAPPTPEPPTMPPTPPVPTTSPQQRPGLDPQQVQQMLDLGMVLLKRFAEAEAKKTPDQRAKEKSMWAALGTTLLGVIAPLFTAGGAAQAGIWGTVAAQALAWFGQIAPLPGLAVPTNSGMVLTTILGTVASGFTQMINRVTQREPKSLDDNGRSLDD